MSEEFREEDNLEKLRELVEFLKANDIAEFETERGDRKTRIKFASAVSASAPAGFDAGLMAQMMASAGGAAAPRPAPAVPAEAPAAAHHQVKSPIVGTFYESPSPGSPAFVKIGDMVEVGQVLCIVEAMKLMNEIESDVAGEVVERIAKSGSPVEYGQPLFAIKAS